MCSLVIACGTYDGVVFALKYLHDNFVKSVQKPLKPIFVDPSGHDGSVEAVAIKDDVVLSGGTDEIIQVWLIFIINKLMII